MRSLFAADGALAPAAASGRAWYRPLHAFPPWTPTDARQEVIDEALTWAARSSRIDAMPELVARGADVDNNVYRGTPLLWAIYSDRAEAAAWLLDHGADVNLRHDFGGAEHGKQATALHLAAQYGCVRCIELLLARGPDPALRDAAYDGTPRGWAEHHGQPRAVLALFD